MTLGTKNRRAFLQTSAVAAAGIGLMGTARAASAQDATPMASVAGELGLPDPASRQGQYLDTADGASIFYQVTGEGEPLLLLHGYPLSGALFARNVEVLSQEYQVITVDHRGYGLSLTPAVPDNVAIYASDAMAVLDELGIDQAIIGGHSMGGPITFEMYQMAPERFRGMILIDTIAAPASPIEAGLWNGFIAEVEQLGISMAYVNNLIKEMLSGDTRLNQPEQAQYLATVVQQASVESAIGGATALANRPDYTDLLGQIEVPTLVYTGIEDTVYPFPVSQMLAEAIPNSTLATIPGASHAAIFEAPDESNQAILDWARQIS